MAAKAKEIEQYDPERKNCVGFPFNPDILSKCGYTFEIDQETGGLRITNKKNTFLNVLFYEDEDGRALMKAGKLSQFRLVANDTLKIEKDKGEENLSSSVTKQAELLF